MAQLSLELKEYLKSSDSPTTQVLVKVKTPHQPQPPRSRDEDLYTAYERAAEQNRADLIKALQEERVHDDRVKFKPIDMFNQVALKAPPKVITRVAKRPDVDKVVLDEPTDVFDGLDI